jgi:hypothetical protein
MVSLEQKLDLPAHLFQFIPFNLNALKLYFNKENELALTEGDANCINVCQRYSYPLVYMIL